MVDLVNQRKKHFAEERAKAKRNKPMTQSQLRIYMSNYLKNQGTWKLSQLKKLKFEEIKEEFEKLVKQIDTFVPINIEATKAQVGKRKKQKARKGISIDKSPQGDSETDKEESVEAMNPTPLDTKSNIVTNWKILQQGKKSIYQIIRANGVDTVYMSSRAMLKDFTRKDLIELYRLVMQKYGTNRPEDAYDRVLWSDLRTMFDPPLNEDAIWSLPLQQKMISWRYYDKCAVHCLTLEACNICMLADRNACRVHCLNLESVDVYMLIERKYPLSAESTMSNRHKDWLVQEQTALGKDFSNPFMADNLPKIVMKKRDSLYQHQEAGKQEKNQMGLLTMDDGIVNWGEHTEAEETNHALMAISSSNEVSLCSKTCIDSYNKLKLLYDEQMNQLGDQEAQILAYSQAVKKLEAQLVTSQKQQLSLNEKLAFQANEIHEKDEKLKRYRRIGMKAVKEKEQLQKTVDSWKDSSKNLWRLINSGMSSNDKLGLGFEIKSNDEVLSYEEEMNFSVFKCSKEDSIGKPSYSRFTKTNDFKGVPHPLSGDYTPKPQEEIDDSLYVYGKKGPQKPEISVSDENSSEHSSCQSNDSEGSCENISEHSFETESESVSEPNEMSQSRLKVPNEKDVSALKSKEVEPSYVSHIKTSRQPLKDKETHKVNRKNWNEMMER
ncbi:hypothetical protein Tco_1546937, partial [Tanacetum coccineum]